MHDSLVPFWRCSHGELMRCVCLNGCCYTPREVPEVESKELLIVQTPPLAEEEGEA